MAEWKIVEETAIPAGLYRVRWSWSPRFQRLTPEIVEVEGFTGIRLHAGIRHTHTAGCVLVGFARANTRELLPGIAARQEVDRLIADCYDREEPVWIRIDNPRTTDPGLERSRVVNV